MKKITIMLALLFGVVLQAQTAFDFQCEDETAEVTVRARIADDFYYDFTFVEGGSLTVGHSIPLPEGLVLSKAIPVQAEYQLNDSEPQVRSKRSYRAADSETVGLTLQITLEHWTFGLPAYKKYKWKGYNQGDLEIDVREDFEDYFSLPSRKVGVDIIHDDLPTKQIAFEFESGGVEEKTITYKIPDGFEASQSFTAYEINNSDYKVEFAFARAGSKEVDITIKLKDNFSYGDDDDISSKNLTSVVKAHNLGNLAELAGINDLDTQAAPYTQLQKIRYNYKTSNAAPVAHYASQTLSGNKLARYAGDSKIFKVSYGSVYGSNGAPATGSSDVRFDSVRINGGVYNGYVRVHDGVNWDVFAKWNAGGGNQQVIYVTHTNFVFGNPQITFTKDYYGNPFGSLGLLINGFDPNGTPATIGSEARTFSWDFRLSSTKVRDGAYINLSASSVDYTYGNTHIHVSEDIPFSPTNLQSQLTASSDWNRFEDERVVGGILDGYVLVNNGSTYDVFAKWDEDSTKWSRAIVTHSNFAWSAPYNLKRRLDLYTGDPQTDSYDDRYGNLETLLQPYNTKTYDEYGGTVTNNADRYFKMYVKTTSNGQTKHFTGFTIHGQNDVSDRVGNAKIFKATYTSTAVYPEKSSSNSVFDNYRIKGGKYDGYVRVYGAGSSDYRGYDLFMRFDYHENEFDLLFIAHGDFNWTGGTVNMYPDLYDGW